MVSILGAVDKNRKRHKKGCGRAGQRTIVIIPNGDIHFCGFLAAQGFPPINNIRKVNDFSDFWMKLHSQDKLVNLQNDLNIYNSIPGVQKTSCLAYAMLTQKHLP